MSQVFEQQCRERILAAAAGAPLLLRGGGSKDFYGRPVQGDIVDTRSHRGVVAYEPTELVVTVKAGTPLAELEAVLAEKGQYLAFEPPHFGPDATVGGMVAAGLSGPRRAQAGAVRDFVLGVRLMDGQGQVLNFGGQVMKNVAGYDVPRLLAGSLGQLGLLLEVSLKVLPRPVAEATIRLETSQAKALALMNQWGGKPLPISATVWSDAGHPDGEAITVRLSGARAAVAAAQAALGGTLVEAGIASAFWAGVREQTHPFFAGAGGANEPALWRLAVPSTAPQLDLPGRTLVEWGGAQRWLVSDAEPRRIRETAEKAGGHATLFRGPAAARDQAFHPLASPLLDIHRRLKATFDPRGVFAAGRLYEGL
ncbi:glycolate oxidase FAD binding subunit [Azospira oryzae]|uniref:Glycolate oxidase FAD binding subunit n=1 Tax=Azospira oryzae TaxID=146939 RepID=A0ABY0ISP0_9RHOO|nr:glycolate oxidase subunit GlcE [Azospira oryzae]RZT90605.1 glycolate oxidase FAD binding subunit [Azospira oryzae]